MNVAQRRASHVPWSAARCAQASPAAPRAIAAATVVAFGRRSMNADAARASDILVYLLTRTSRKHFFSALNSRSQQPRSSAPASMAAFMHAP